ncbi:hypothetical protein GOBAR_DD21271 [Gossypium barbadense]|nr:hypothetical protein GOBAR_DD21271 [Gossypium barbadense]
MHAICVRRSCPTSNQLTPLLHENTTGCQTLPSTRTLDGIRPGVLELSPLDPLKTTTKLLEVYFPERDLEGRKGEKSGEGGGSASKTAGCQGESKVLDFEG